MTETQGAAAPAEQEARKQRTQKVGRVVSNKMDKSVVVAVDFVRRHPLYRGHDAAVAVEVIEHLDPGPRAAFERVLFGYAEARTVVVTTPNREYNALSPPPCALRRSRTARARTRPAVPGRGAR